MKLLKLLLGVLITVSCISHTLIAQEREYEEIIEEVHVENEILIITGVYIGIEDGMYVFTFKEEEDTQFVIPYIKEEGEESTIYFDELSSEAEQSYDLSKKSMIGNKFEVSYSEIYEEEESEDGEIEYISVKSILTLRKIEKPSKIILQRR